MSIEEDLVRAAAEAVRIAGRETRQKAQKPATGAPPPDESTPAEIADNVPVFVVPPIDVPAETAPVAPAAQPVPVSIASSTPVKAEGVAPVKPAFAPGPEPAVPPQSKTGIELKKSAFPRPAELKPEAKSLPEIPSAVKIADIRLPSYMKGVLSQPAKPAPKATPEAERSIREIGVGPTGAARPRGGKNIVAIAKDKRTEIDENGLPRIRTYAQDMSDEIRRRGSTLTSIVGAEREREAERSARVDERVALTNRRLALVLGAFIFVGIGIGAIAGVLLFTGEKDAITIKLSIIPENKKTHVDVSGGEAAEALAAARQDTELSLGEIARLIVSDGVGELAPETLLLALNAPAELARNADRVMVGVHAFDRNQPFIIIETRYYDLAFGAMLSWEEKMAKTLGAFYAPVLARTL
ncbi:MAG: hypothetical protein AAB923_01945, partial [Patescibacteria group bacterium]